MLECKRSSSGSGAKQIYSHRVPRSINRHEQDSTIAPSSVIYVGIFSHWHRKSSPTIELSMQKTSTSRSWFDSCHFSQLTIQASPSFPQCPLAIFWPRFGESPAVEMERKIYKASCQSFWRATKVIPETGARAAAGAAVNQRYTKLYPNPIYGVG